MTILLRWWLVTCLCVLGAAALAFFGFFQYLWKSDISKLGFVAIAVFAMANVWVGILCSQARYSQGFQRHIRMLEYAQELLFNLGLAGSLIGLLHMLESLGTGVIGDTESRAMREGMKTVGLTTLVGVIGGLIIKLQTLNLLYATEDDAETETEDEEDEDLDEEEVDDDEFTDRFAAKEQADIEAGDDKGR